jgi:hypothetical protein
MESVTRLAWKFLGAEAPEGGFTGHGKATAVAEVELLQVVAPDGPPSP